MDRLIYGDGKLFLFFQLSAWHHGIKITVVGLENGPEGMAWAG